MAKLDESTLVQMGREYPKCSASVIVENMQDIAKLAKRHESLCVRECNEADFDALKITKLEARIGSFVGMIFPGTAVITHRDPRGATVKLFPPSGATNDWGREGIFVYSHDYLAGMIMLGMIPATIAVVGAVEAVRALWRWLRLNPQERRIMRLKSK